MIAGSEYNLNLAKSYLPTWGAWEVAREIICNAIDADPDYIVESDGPNHLRVKTNTVPDLSEMLVIGHGSKAPGGETIGQFGEGAKMAALTATRMGGDIVFRSPGKVMRFGFTETMGVQTLCAFVEEVEGGEGFTADINLSMVGTVSNGRILRNANFGPVKSSHPDYMRVHVKGVYITEIPSPSLWDWNFDNQMTLNRDRSMVSDFDVRFAIGRWLGENITDEQAKAIIATSESVERDSARYGKACHRLRTALRRAFYELHGEQSVLATGHGTDDTATKDGWNVVVINPPEFREVLHEAGVKFSHDVLRKSHEMEAVDHRPYLLEIEQLRRLDEIVKAPNVKVRVFANKSKALGMADLAENELWLSETLFREGSEHQRVSTYLHEMAHFISNASDETLEFERALDEIAGTLGVRALAVSA